MPPYAADTTAMILDTSSHSHQHDVKMADSSASTANNNITAQPQHLMESSSSKKSRRRKTMTNNKRSVSFNDYDEVVEIKHISDFSRRRIAATYWSSEEREVFRLDAMKLIHDEEIEPTHLSLSLKTGEQAPASEQTGVEDDFRGLDQHTTTYSDKCRRNVDELYDVVYECQTFEDTEGARVPDQVLADLLWEVSQHTTRAARVRAIADEVRALQS